MSEQQGQSRMQRHNSVQSQTETVQNQSMHTSAQQSDDAAFDALLDEIDGVLETNAEEYVRSFVQKGGQ